MSKRSTFKTLYGLLNFVGGLTTLYFMVIRPWHLKWGATTGEVQRVLPGDDFVPQPKIDATHAVTVRASIDRVWPWLVQIGQGRGGFYSYDFIENALGLNIHNADRIAPEFQNLKVGDLVPLAPGGIGVPVAILEPPHTLVLHWDTRAGSAGAPPLRPGDFLNTAWGWHLEAIDATTTRLVERWRADYGSNLLNTLVYRLFLEPGAFLMERKMLLGIKERAERWNGEAI